jgi:hypothetical protein
MKFILKLFDKQKVNKQQKKTTRTQIYKPSRNLPAISNSSNHNKRNQNTHQTQTEALTTDLKQNIHVIQSAYDKSSDFILRQFTISDSLNAAVIYIEGLSSIEEINRSVLNPLQSESNVTDFKKIIEQKLAVSNIKNLQTYSEIIEQVSVGNPVLLIDGETYALSLGLSDWEKRGVEEPSAENVVRGPRDGFTETLRVNTSLIRRRIRSPKLKMMTQYLGEYTQTQVVIAYIDGLVDNTLLEEVENRLQRIKIDGIVDSGYIEEMIEDDPFSPFPQILNTERVDVVTANLLEGRVAVIVEGSPFILVLPTTLYSLLQSPEDYFQRFWIGSAIRWLRYIFFIISVLLPSIYVAILTYHQEMIPTTLLLSITASREQIPFPALIEALMMEFTFEALREAGLRLPKQVGAAVSIVGALVIGEAAVSAGIVSAPMVMVVAITGIASFTIPRYNLGISLRMLRFPIMIIAGTLGLLGIMLALITIVIHLASLRSFGVPYLSPMGPMKIRDMKDVLLRAPWWMMNKRPHLTGDYNENRQASKQKPGPEQGKG